MTEDSLPYGGMKVPQFVVAHEAREPLTMGGLTFPNRKMKYATTNKPWDGSFTRDLALCPSWPILC
jgi:hypothetical protein